MRIWCFCLCGALMWGAAAPSVEPTAMIPALHGTALNGAKVDLPDVLKGKTAVLVVGFSQDSRDEMTAWGRRLAGDYRDSDAVTYYEMPVLAGVPKLLRGWVVKKVAEAVPDPAKSRFIPVYDHEAQWKSVAGFDKADEAYVLIVQDNGKVGWKTEGPAGDAAYDQVKRRVEEMAAR